MRIGFVGKRTLEVLHNALLDVTEISRNPYSNKSLSADITQLDSLGAIEEKFDCVVICAAKLPQKDYTFQDLNDYVDVNVTGVNNILVWASQRNVSRIICCSTLSFLPALGTAREGELIDTGSHFAYKISKAAAEHFVIGFCNERNIQYGALRISS